MKKYVLLLVTLLRGQTLYAESQMGMQFGPSLSWNRVVSPSEMSSPVSSPGWAVRGHGGIIYDRSFLKDNYYFSTGLIYSAQRFSIKQAGESADSSQYNLDFVQVPILAKFYTNELLLDVRAYVKTGLLPQFNFNAILTKGTVGAVDFNYGSLEGVLGVGGELELGIGTSVFMGLGRHSGLTNMLKSYKSKDNVRGYASSWVVEVGAKF